MLTADHQCSGLRINSQHFACANCCRSGFPLAVFASRLLLLRPAARVIFMRMILATKNTMRTMNSRLPIMIRTMTIMSPGIAYEGEEPVYIAPKKKKTVKAVPAAKPVVKKSVASTEKKAVTPSVASVEKKAVTSAEKKTASAAPGMSCDKAGKIVSGYGFTSVKPTTCTGQVFAFNATRSGKAYVIKLSSASGELTEVKKVQ